MLVKLFILDFMKKYFLFFTLLILVSCSKENVSETIQPNDSLNVAIDSAKAKATDSLTLEKITPRDIRIINNEILNLLKTRDYEKFAQYIHPEKGVRFSMYGYVQPKKDKIFSKKDFQKYIGTTIKFTWGEKDGTGDLFQLSLKNYLEKWVFVKDFTQGEFSVNEIINRGNTINNIKRIYPTATFTENYLGGSKEYAEMDWNSLRLVFEELEGELFLVGIINDRWTI